MRRSPHGVHDAASGVAKSANPSPEPGEFMGLPTKRQAKKQLLGDVKAWCAAQPEAASEQSAADVIEKLWGIEQVLFGEGSRRRDKEQIRHGHL